MKRREALKNLLIGSAAAFTLPFLTKEMVAQDAVYGINDLMYWKLEPTGACARVRDGKIGIQLRFCFYLTDKSAFYKSRLVEEKKVTQIGVKYSEIEKIKVPVYKVENTGRTINTPFHNHIVAIPVKFCTDGLISSLGERYLKIVYDYYQAGNYIDGNNPPIIDNINLTFDDYSEEIEVEILKRVAQIKTNTK